MIPTWCIGRRRDSSKVPMGVTCKFSIRVRWGLVLCNLQCSVHQHSPRTVPGRQDARCLRDYVIIASRRSIAVAVAIASFTLDNLISSINNIVLMTL